MLIVILDVFSMLLNDFATKKGDRREKNRNSILSAIAIGKTGLKRIFLSRCSKSLS